jgi:hypothetical protein
MSRRTSNDDVTTDLSSRRLAAGRRRLVVTTVAPPALAHVVEAVASIPSEQGEDRETLDRAIQTAIDDVVAHAIAFEPTIVSLLDAKVVGDRSTSSAHRRS